MLNNDPIGAAIQDYHLKNSYEDITVESDILEDDFIPTKYLFREYKDFPELEKIAMQHCNGKILDVGAAAGPHASYLSEQNLEVSTIEISPLAHKYLQKILPESLHYKCPIEEFNTNTFDTILLLMNGIGLAGTFNNIEPFLEHLISLLNENGSILCESTDVIDIFEDEEGGLWVDLSAEYYGDFRFNMKYKNHQSGWFNWVYLDRANFQKIAEKVGLKFEIIYDDETSFLVKLTKVI